LFQHLNNLFRESEFADLEASDPDRALVVEPAPEPTDVLWQNLEIDDDERFRRTCLTYVVTGMIVLMSAACCAVLTTLKHNGPEWIGYGRDDDSWWAWAFSLGLSAATAIGINVANFVIYTYVYAATEHERHLSRTLHERSLFTKLSLAYLANTVALPLIVGCVPFGPTQGWYEEGRGGVHAATLHASAHHGALTSPGTRWVAPSTQLRSSCSRALSSTSSSR
jgi:hypothetical protein